MTTAEIISTPLASPGAVAFLGKEGAYWRLRIKGAAERALRRKVVGLGIAATASLIMTAIVGVPALTSRLIPLISLSVELKLDNAVDKQVRSALDSHHRGARFECGNTPGETAGRDALQKLVARLEAAADLPFALHVDVVRRDEPNAYALPGGRICVYQGLIDQAQSPDALMNEAGGNAHALATILSRIVSDKEHGMKILPDHPETKESISAIDALSGVGAARPLLDAEDWSALKQICAVPAGGAASGNGQATKADNDGATANH